MPLVCFPRAAVALKGLALYFHPTTVAEHHPLTRCIVDDAIQRAIHHLAVFASFDAGSGRFWHLVIGVKL